MQTLSKEAERRITEALNEVVDLVNNGTDPTDAMTKVATDRQIPAGHVQLMTNAFNIGRSEAQRKGTSDLLDKAADFQLADASQVLDRMFPGTVKAAGVLADEASVSKDYTLPPSRLLVNRTTAEKMAAAAGINWKMVDAPPQSPAPHSTASKEAFARLADLRRGHEEARRVAQAGFDLVTSRVEKLATALLVADNTSFRDVARNATFRFGKVAKALFDELEKQHRVLGKQAGAATARSHVVQWDASPYREVCDVVTATETFMKASEAYEKSALAYDNKTQEILHPFAPAAPEHGSVLPQSLTEKVAFLGGLFGTAIGSSMGRQMGDKLVKPTEALQGSMQKKITDPQHEAEMRNYQTQAMLNDFLANDDVISTYDPGEVVNHFNEISQLSPRASNQSALMRSLLRRRVQQGALDPYEIDQLMKIEQGLKNRDAAPNGGILNGPAGIM